MQFRRNFLKPNPYPKNNPPKCMHACVSKHSIQYHEIGIEVKQIAFLTIDSEVCSIGDDQSSCNRHIWIRSLCSRSSPMIGKHEVQSKKKRFACLIRCTHVSSRSQTLREMQGIEMGYEEMVERTRAKDLREMQRKKINISCLFLPSV